MSMTVDNYPHAKVEAARKRYEARLAEIGPIDYGAIHVAWDEAKRRHMTHDLVAVARDERGTGMSTQWQRIDAPEEAFMERFATLDHVPPSFRVIRDEWVDDPGPSEHNPEDLPERTILEVEVIT